MSQNGVVPNSENSERTVANCVVELVVKTVCYNVKSKCFSPVGGMAPATVGHTGAPPLSLYGLDLS
jgi:hypothetical protein